MKKLLLILTILSICLSSLFSQIAVNTDGSGANVNAILDVKSTEYGLLMPRMTQTEIAAIASPANSLIVFNTTDDKFYSYISSGNVWKEIALGTTVIASWGCGSSITDSRDGETYATVQIGTQCWMAENLNVGIINDGPWLQSDNDTIEKYCYDGTETNCDTYGGLYEWNELMNYASPELQGICPDGWHVPTDAEWCTLENEVDFGSVPCGTTGWRGMDVGSNLKETGTSHWTMPNSSATNSSGFTALPAGFRYTNGASLYLNDEAYFWSSTDNNPLIPGRWLSYNNTKIYRDTFFKDYACSVRCIKD